MPRYLVTYRVKVEAETPEEACRMAGFAAARGAGDPDVQGVEVPKEALFSCKEIQEVDGERQWVEV